MLRRFFVGWWLFAVGACASNSPAFGGANAVRDAAEVTGTIADGAQPISDVAKSPIREATPQVDGGRNAADQLDAATVAAEKDAEIQADTQDAADADAADVADAFKADVGLDQTAKKDAADSCTPYDEQCQDGQVFECNQQGTGWALIEDCAAIGLLCGFEQGMGMVMCLDPPCKPSALGCDGENVVQCDATAKSWVIITDCTAKKAVCTGAKCVPIICTPYEYLCQGAKLLACNYNGSTWELDTDCSATGQVCLQDKCAKPP